ncbi:MAG: NAD-dependent epimerase/dehydratase family protein, partial [Terracidiphilus sp.]
MAYLLDWGAFALSGFLAFELRFDGALPVRYLHPMAVFLCIWVLAKSDAFIAAKLNRGNWRYTSAYDAVRIILANSAGSILGGLVIFLLPAPWGIPRSVYILDWLVSCLLTLGGRLAARVVITTRMTHRAKGDQTRTLIYGAGTAGLALLWELRQNRSLKCDVVGLIDDDPSKAHLILQGKPVLGSGEDLRKVVRAHAIKRVLIAIPSATEEQMVRILKFAIDAEVEFKMVPGLGDIIQSAELGEQIRSGNVTIEHMLSRRKTDKISESRKRVLLIGGAGYIGSGLLPKLLNDGYRVRLLDAFLYGEDPIARWKNHPGLEIVEADFRRVDIVVRAMRDVKAVVHLGAIVGDPACALDEELTIETNLLATRMIAEVTKGEGIEKFIFASSCSVYGASDTYLDENSPLYPVSLYARSKIACENVLLGMKNETFRPVILRFGTIYGLSGRT